MPIESTIFEVSSDIYFIVYDLYYVSQNDELGIRAGPIHRDGGSNYYQFMYVCFCALLIN
jgi:hypothetical protein